MAGSLQRPTYALAVLVAIVAGAFSVAWQAQGAAPPPTDGQIQSYDSNITINPDGTLFVVETIKVSTSALKMRQGLYRDVLTRYHDRFANPYAVHMEVQSVMCDAQPAPYHLEKIPSGLRIYMRNNREAGAPSEHIYELTYVVDRAIGFFADHDELYWNVTGTFWTLPIMDISATLHLPKGIAREAILPDGYTGRQGSAGSDYRAAADSQGNITFRTTRPLMSHEGLAVAVRWPKGFVRPPTDEQKRRYFLEDHQAALIGIIGLVAILALYAIAWRIAGRTGAQGEFAPLSEPPRGFSPAALRCLWRSGFDQKALVANLADLAVKRQLAILESGAGSLILGRLNSKRAAARLGAQDEPLLQITADEQVVLDRLFIAGETIALEPGNRAVIGNTVEALRHHLRSRLERVYIVTNLRYWIPGLLISISAVVRCGFSIQGAQRPLVLFLSMGLMLWSLGWLTVAAHSVSSWRSAIADAHYAPTARKQALAMSALCFALTIIEAAGLALLAWAASPGVATVLLLLAAINFIFHCLLKAPTRSGRALMDEVEAFRMFLASTDKDHHKRSTLAEITPSLFASLLPYAIALNVEKAWGEKFAAGLAHTPHARTLSYSPDWYSGPGWNALTVATFVTSLAASFSSAISWATKAPGSKATRA